MIKLGRFVFAGLLSTFIVLGSWGYVGKAHGTPIIDFAVGPPHSGSASVSYQGGANPLVGVDLSVFNVVGVGTPSNGGAQFRIFNGDLDFTTGNFTGNNTNTWNFGGGGTITLTGGVDLNNNGIEDAGDIPSGTILLTGSFTAASVSAYGEFFKISGASFYDSKNKDLTEFFGLPNSSYDGNFNISFLAQGLPPNGFSSITVGSGDVINIPVPEPATVSLFGCGLIGLAWFGRRKSGKG